MVTRAVQDDQKRNYRDAYYAYCDGLQYFVPLIAGETDADRRLCLQQAATNYMERAEEIKRSYIEAFTEQPNSINSTDSIQSGEASSSLVNENPVKAALKPTSNYNEIRKSIIIALY